MSAVGALNYLAIATRPDISYTVGVLARFNSNPGNQHWTALRHLMRYLQGTKDLKLTYGPSNSPEIFMTWCDADHAGNPDTGKSTSGYIVKIGSGAISWASKQQPIVAKSTTEAEFVAANFAGDEAVWLRKLLGELGYEFDYASTLHIDNKSAIQVARNPEHHGRMKHMDLRFYWLRDMVDAGLIRVDYIATEAMPADGLTKLLGKLKVAEMAGRLGLRK